MGSISLGHEVVERMSTRPVEKNEGSGLTTIAIAVWAVVVLIAFLSNRGGDVGQIAKLFGNLGGGPLFGAGVADSLIGVAAASLIALSWYGLGGFAMSKIFGSELDDRSPFIRFAMDAAAGAAIWSLIWFFGGIAGAYSELAALGALVIGSGLGVWRLRKVWNNRDRASEKLGSDVALLALIAIPIVLAFVASLAPPTAKDTLLYHFSVPKAFVAHGGLHFIEGHIASYLALGTEMHVVWALLLGGVIGPRAAEASAGATVFIFFPLLLAAVYGWAGELNLPRRWRLIAVLIVATVPTAYHVAASAYIDLSLALYVTLAIYALGRWWKSQSIAWLLCVGLFLGAALSVKLTTLFVIAAFALMVLLRARQAKDDDSQNLGRILGFGLAGLVLAGVIASPWYLRTWAETGSPIFPFYMSVWEGEAPGWDVERSNLFQGMNSQYGGAAKKPVDYLLAPWNLSVAAQPELAEYFDGVIGVGFLFGLPLLAWALWKFDLPPELKIGVAVAGIMFMFWLFSSQQLRYLLPILPVLALGIVAAAAVMAERVGGLRSVVQLSLVASAIAAILVSAAWFLQKAPLRVVMGGESRDEYLSRNLDYYPYYAELHAQAEPGSKVWLINMRRDTYNLDRPYFSDYLFEDWTLRKLLWESRSVQELKAKTKAMGIDYVLTRHDFLFDYQRSTLVDDSRPRQENDEKLRIARGFILDPANTIKADRKFSLVRVF